MKGLGPSSRRPRPRQHSTSSGEARRPARAAQRLALAARSFVVRVAGLEISQPADAVLAGRLRCTLDARERKVVEWFAPAKTAAFAAHAAICRQEQEALAPYRRARILLNEKLAEWRLAQESLSPTPGLASEAGLEGIHFRVRWQAEVINLVALVRAVAAKPQLIALLRPDQRALNHLAQAQKEAFQLAGVRVWSDRLVVAAPRSDSKREHRAALAASSGGIQA